MAQGIVCDVEVEKPEPKEPKLAGVDRNVGNVATADMVLELPERVQEEMKKLEKNSTLAARDETSSGARPQGTHTPFQTL